MKTITLEDYEAELVLELIRDYRKGVERGDVSTNQPRADELNDVDSIIAAFEDRR